MTLGKRRQLEPSCFLHRPRFGVSLQSSRELFDYRAKYSRRRVLHTYLRPGVENQVMSYRVPTKRSTMHLNGILITRVVKGSRRMKVRGGSGTFFLLKF